MDWFKSSTDSRLPDWLRDNLNSVCPECGSDMENGYNNNGECTRRRCTNPKCPKMIGERIGKMCDILGIQGIKGGIGLQYARSHKLESHFDALPHILNGKKVDVHLYQLLQCTFIYGIDSEFVNIAGENSSVEELFEKYYGKYRNELLNYKEELLRAEQYVNIIDVVKVEKKFNPVVFGDIVITGEIPGFANRDTFVAQVNKFYKGLTDFGYSRSKRKTGLYCCIAEDKTATTGKVQEAKEAGFPIYTFSEFIRSVNNKIIEAGYGDCLKEIGKGD